MKIMIWSPKGGTAKSSISACLLQSLDGDYQIITNDKMNPYNLILDDKLYYLVPNGDEIPTYPGQDYNLIYDFGGWGDPRIVSTIKNDKDIIVLIPFLPDIVSFQSALSIMGEISSITNRIMFVISRTKKDDYSIFREQMNKIGITNKLIEIKESKLFINLFNKNQSIKEIKKDKLLSYSYKNVFNQIDTLIKELKKW